MTREEAIKRLEDTLEAWERWECPPHSPAGLLNEALGMAIAALREQDATDTNVGNKWISVEERLPKKQTDVLMLFENNMAVGYWFDGDEVVTFWRVYTDDGWCTDCDCEPTHWMPLPEPPEVEV